MVHSVEELRLLVTGMQQAGVVEASEARIATRAFPPDGASTAAGLGVPAGLLAQPLDGAPALAAEQPATTALRTML